jgi:hypothetical protein
MYWEELVTFLNQDWWSESDDCCSFLTNDFFHLLLVDFFICLFFEAKNSLIYWFFFELTLILIFWILSLSSITFNLHIFAWVYLHRPFLVQNQVSRDYFLTYHVKLKEEDHWSSNHEKMSYLLNSLRTIRKNVFHHDNTFN